MVCKASYGNRTYNARACGCVCACACAVSLLLRNKVIMILYRLFIVDICAISGASELHDMVSFECQIPLLPSQMAWLSISFYEEVNKLLMITEGLKLHVFCHFHCTAYERIHALYAPLSKRLMRYMPSMVSISTVE